MKRILILSDSHSHIGPDVLKHVASYDEVWHAGDWGDIKVHDALAEQCPVIRGVYGNIDGRDVRIIYPKEVVFVTEGVKITMLHIAGYPGRYKPEALELIRRHQPDIFVTGHSHILKVMFDKKHQHLHINPGAMGLHGFHQVRTLVSLELDAGKIQNANVIELKKFS